MNSLHEVTEPFVSVVMPCYNSRATIGDTLASLEAQHYPRDRFEVVVADNGSTDGSREWIAEHFPRVRMVRATEKGSGYARNAGFAAAEGQWILSIDSDCVADPQWMVTLVRAMQQAPEETAAIGGSIVPYSKKTAVEQYHLAWVSQPDVSNPSLKFRYTATPNAIFHAARMREIGGFDGTLGFDDTDLGIRFGEAGYKILYAEQAIVRHRNPVTLNELFRHRRKYGEFSFTLARKHVALMGDPSGAAKRQKLFRETIVRIGKDMIKLPLSVVYRPKGAPIGWPVIDAVMAWGNYQGYSRISSRSDGRSV